MTNAVFMQEALDTPARYVWASGSDASGKTAFLVKKAHELMRNGMSAADICVVVGTADAAAIMRKRLMNEASVLAQVCVATLTEVLVSLLNTPEARDVTGRVPRLLTRVERAVLRADLGSDAQGSRLIDCLRARGGMLHEELPSVTLSYLNSEAGVSSRGLYEAILVDDARAVSPEAFCVLDHLAKSFLIAAGSPSDSGAFSDVFPDAVCVQLEPARSENDLACAFCRPSLVECVKWRQPEDEFKGIAAMVREFLRKDESLFEEDVYIAVPNRPWAGRVSKALAARGLSASIVLDGDALRGNPKEASNSALLQEYALLALLANPNDILAWRLWCACGSSTYRKEQWCKMESQFVDKEKPFVEAIREWVTHADGPDEFELAQHCARAMDIAESASQLRGFSLLKAVASNQDKSLLRSLVSHIDGDEDAATLFSRVEAYVLDPMFAQDAHAVRVGSLARLQGLSPRIVIIAGAVDGFMPVGTSEDAVQAERALFRAAIAKATDRLVISLVQKVDAQIAERMRMRPRRFKMENGRKMAMLARSPFIDEAGDAVPGTVSGEQRVSQRVQC